MLTQGEYVISCRVEEDDSESLDSVEVGAVVYSFHNLHFQILY
ncbi:hypothetical protein HMPREF1207_05210 [Paenibacillus sp. HGH0039]|nr:hypothetical protein HMPREF1207_05210 [Paenibacillus sp. HGH0039]